jgi:myb proto-oncogene protein
MCVLAFILINDDCWLHNWQILNAEEELKRRNSVQQQVHGPSVPLKADGTNDTSSVSRYMAPRMGSEGNLVGEVDGGEADDFTNHNMQHSHLVLRTSSMSPSSESPLRRTPSGQQNMVMHVVYHN